MKKRTFTIFLIWTFLFLAIAPSGYVQEAPDVKNHSSIEDAKVSMDFENAPLKTVLKAFSKQANMNFIASDVIEGKLITVYLNNVSINEALSSILDANGLTYEIQTGGVYLIKALGAGTVKTFTRVYRLKYLQVYNMSEQTGTVTSTTNVTIIGSPTIAAAGSTPTTSAASTTESTQASGKDLALGDSKPKNITEIIRLLMTKYGKIVADRRNNSLVVTDVPEVFDNIEKTIKALDVEPVQILIQAEIIETTTSALKRIGIEWGGDESTQFMKFTYGKGSPAVTGAQNPVWPTPFPFTENFVKDTFGTNIPTAALFKYGTLTMQDFDIVIKLISQDQDTKYLSRPKIMTINNEPAVIKVSANTAIGKVNTSVSQVGSTIDTAERAETGIVLNVTPQVSENGFIFMFIQPSVSRAVASTLFSTTFMDPSYRTSASTVMVRDGETIYIGGLIQTDNFKISRKVPFLGDIPIIGEPFKSRYTRVNDTELIIFVTPHIVKKRDAQFVAPAGTQERDSIMENAMERTAEKLAKKNKNKDKKEVNISSKKAVQMRNNTIKDTMEKYSVKK